MSTLISWSDEVWNPTTGCDRVSPGCAHCYALTLAGRYRHNPKMQELNIYQRDGGRASGPGFGLTLRPEVLEKPLHWKKPKRVFVNSMSDLFHEGIPDEFIADVFAVIQLAPWHTFQILTKRIERAARLLHGRRWQLLLDTAVSNRLGYVAFADRVQGNVLIGPTVENQKMATKRLPKTQKLHALGWRTMVSYEPALQAVDFEPYLDGIDWLICGGESGPKRRPFNHAWARAALYQARHNHVPFFMKQDSALRSEVYETLPDDLKVREFPA